MGSRPLEEAGNVKETADGLHLRGLHSVADDISLCLFGRLPRAIGTKSLCGRPDPLGPAQPAPSSLSRLLSSILCEAGRPVGDGAGFLRQQMQV